MPCHRGRGDLVSYRLYLLWHLRRQISGSYHGVCALECSAAWRGVDGRVVAAVGRAPPVHGMVASPGNIHMHHHVDDGGK